MSHIIENLFYGNIEPQELKTDITPKLKEKLRMLSDKEDQIRKRLTEEDCKLFNEYTELATGFNSLSCLDSFIGGVRIGGKLIYDLFVG